MPGEYHVCVSSMIRVGQLCLCVSTESKHSEQKAPGTFKPSKPYEKQSKNESTHRSVPGVFTVEAFPTPAQVEWEGDKGEEAEREKRSFPSDLILELSHHCRWSKDRHRVTRVCSEAS